MFESQLIESKIKCINIEVIHTYREFSRQQDFNQEMNTILG